MSRLAAASFSYHHDPGQLSAQFVWQRLAWLFRPPTVHRIVGGWTALVEQLARRARELEVKIECGQTVDVVPRAPVILALELRDANKLLGRNLAWDSAGGVALDIGLQHRRGDPGTIIDLDHGVLVQAQHPSAGPRGHRLYQAHVGMRPRETVDHASRRIETVFDHGLPRWRERVVWRRRMTVAGRTGAVDYPGTTWRDRPDVVQGKGIFLAGDMVAADGLLSEVSFTSAVRSARLAVAHTKAYGEAKADHKTGRKDSSDP